MVHFYSFPFYMEFAFLRSNWLLWAHTLCLSHTLKPALLLNSHSLFIRSNRNQKCKRTKLKRVGLHLILCRHKITSKYKLSKSSNESHIFFQVLTLIFLYLIA